MPNRDAVRRALTVISSPAERTYFFQKLSSPAWVAPLAAEGCFADPPDQIREGEYIRFPGWPESQYLARVAGIVPEEAGDVLLSIPLVDNHRVHLDLVDVALQVAPTVAASWARREAEWVARQSWLAVLLPEKLASLCAHLARHGDFSASMALTLELFRLAPDPHATATPASARVFPPEPRAKMDAWEFSRALDVIVPELVARFPEQSLAPFSTMLAEALRLSSNSANPTPPSDYSFIWRDAIEEDDENGDVRDALIDAVRDIARGAARKVGCTPVAAQLRSYEWDLFRRIALDVIRTSCDEGDSALADALLDRTSFHSAATHHEYALLLRDHFRDLSPEDRAQVLAWIDQGPDRDAVRERHQLADGSGPSDDDIERWVQQWQRDRLSPMRGSLPQPWSARLLELEERYGPPEFDYSLHKTTSGWGAEPSPISAFDFSALTREERRQFLEQWRPDDGFRSPSKAGLVHMIGQLGTAFFSAESTVADAWSELDPAYVSAFIAGLHQVVQGGEPLSWSSVLSLCDTVAQWSATDSDSDWARRAVADLIEAACDKDGDYLPRNESDRVEGILVHLISSSAGHERERISPDVDWLTGAINSVSGKSIEAAIRFAVWRKKQVTESLHASWQLSVHIPRLASAIDRVVDPRGGYPVDARAIFGSQFGPLLWLDPHWVHEHLDELFPTSPEFSDARDAVWQTYLVYGRPFRNALKFVGREYHRSIAGLRPVDGAKDRERNVEYRLAEHLMTLYWQGALDIADRDDFVNQFFASASLGVRKHAIDYIGRSLQNSDAVPPEPLARLRQLITWRIDAIAHLSDDVRPIAAEELQAFGWWFASGVFDPEWALNTLIAILRLKGGVEPDHMVAEFLVTLVDQHPLLVATAFWLMVESQADNMVLLGWNDEARELLERLRTSLDANVRARITAVVDRLLTKGLFEYREFMPSPIPSPITLPQR